MKEIMFIDDRYFGIDSDFTQENFKELYEKKDFKFYFIESIWEAITKTMKNDFPNVDIIVIDYGQVGNPSIIISWIKNNFKDKLIFLRSGNGYGIQHDIKDDYLKTFPIVSNESDLMIHDIMRFIE